MKSKEGKRDWSRAFITCPYCRECVQRRGTQRDHVPPRGLFAKPWSDIQSFRTVRCCEACHRKYSKGDDLLKAMCGMGAIRSAGIEGVEEEVQRALRNNHWWRKALAEQFRESGSEPIYTMGEIETVLPYCYKLSLGEKLSDDLNKTIWRIAVGVIFKINERWDATQHNIEISQIPDYQPEVLNHFAPMLARLSYKEQIRETAFLFAWGFTKESDSHGAMFMSFYCGVHFLILISPKPATDDL